MYIYIYRKKKKEGVEKETRALYRNDATMQNANNTDWSDYHNNNNNNNKSSRRTVYAGNENKRSTRHEIRWEN